MDHIEVSHEISTMCPRGLRVFNTAGDTVRLACDQWACTICRIRLSHHWANRIRYGLALWDGPKRHWVLTLPGHIKTASFGFYVLKRAWHNFYTAIQRQGTPFYYAAFVELHPKRFGIAHFHIVSLRASPGRLKDIAHHAGFGFIDSDDEIEGKLAAYYVSKYTSKQGSQMPKGFRRVRVSRVWPSLPTPIPDPPIITLGTGEQLGAYLQRVFNQTGVPLPDLLARWEHPELDL